MSRYARPPATLLAIALGTLLASGSASAVNKQRSFVQNATGACQSALPVYDGQIRKRPLAVQNEGTASAYVSCSLMGTADGVGGANSMTLVYLYADNNTGSAVDLTCTLVDGYSGINPTYFPKTISLPANTRGVEYLWTAAVDNGGMNFDWTVNVSCNLPVGTGLTLAFTYFIEDVGA